ncbi:hypothetical protein ABK040_012242 [Willaertia magna]
MPIKNNLNDFTSNSTYVIRYNLNDLPIEIIHFIFQYLDYRSLINIMTTNSLHYQLSIQYLLSNSFNLTNVEEEEEEENLKYDQLLKEEQLQYFLNYLLELELNDYFSMKKINVTHFRMTQSKTVQLICKLIKNHNCNELNINFKYYEASEKFTIVNYLKDIINNLSTFNAPFITSTELFTVLNKNNNLQFLTMNEIDTKTFNDYSIFKKLKSLKFIYIIDDSNFLNNLFRDGLQQMEKLEELSITINFNYAHNYRLRLIVIDVDLDLLKNLKGNNLQKLSFYCDLYNELQFNLPNNEEEKNIILQYLEKEQFIFPNLKELVFNCKVSKESGLFLSYLIKKETKLNKLLVTYFTYLNLNKLFKRINFVNEFILTGSYYETINHYNNNNTQTQEEDFNYLWKKLTLFKTTIHNETVQKEELEYLNEVKNCKVKELVNLRYLKLDSCKGAYPLFFIFLLQYNFSKLDKLFLNDCYYISTPILEYTFTKINLQNLIEFEIIGVPFNDELMLTMLNYLQQNKIKLNLDGKITEQGLIKIPKEIRNKITQIKLLNSEINLQNNELLNFLNDLNEDLTDCCLNFSDTGPTKEFLNLISNKFKELKILNIQGSLNEITKEDIMELINKLDKIELVYFNCINYFTVEEVEEFRNNLRSLQKRSPPKIIVPLKYSSPEIRNRTKTGGCLIC